MLHFEIVFIRSPSNLTVSCLHIVLSYRGAPTQHEARVGQSPILVEYGQPLFIWLPRDWPSVRTYVRVYIMYRWGRGDYQKQGRAVSGVSWQIHMYIFYTGHSQYGHLTAVKTGQPLTSITWPYRGLMYQLIEGTWFIWKLSAEQSIVLLDRDQCSISYFLAS